MMSVEGSSVHDVLVRMMLVEQNMTVGGREYSRVVLESSFRSVSMKLEQSEFACAWEDEVLILSSPMMDVMSHRPFERR